MADAAIRSDFRPGERVSFTRTVAETDVMAFARLVGDLAPLHLNAEYAGQSRFGRRLEAIAPSPPVKRQQNRLPPRSWRGTKGEKPCDRAFHRRSPGDQSPGYGAAPNELG